MKRLALPGGQSGSLFAYRMNSSSLVMRKDEYPRVAFRKPWYQRLLESKKSVVMDNTYHMMINCCNILREDDELRNILVKYNKNEGIFSSSFSSVFFFFHSVFVVSKCCTSYMVMFGTNVQPSHA